MLWLGPYSTDFHRFHGLPHTRCRQIDATPAKERLLESLKDSSREVRWGAAKALGGLRDGDVVRGLIERLTDSDGNVRHMAAESLGVISDKSAIAPLMERLLDLDYHVAGGAAEALGRIGLPQPEKALLKCLFRDHSAVRKKAAKALDRLGSKKAWSILVDRLSAAWTHSYVDVRLKDLRILVERILLIR